MSGKDNIMNINNQPLVSVPVITYNSAKFVLETLESIKAQTYQNVELIISDDCSTDNTIELCQKWIEENKDRFVRTQIITVDNNTGISANLNRAEAVCQGEWVKSVAGDDLLMPNSITDYIDYVRNHSDVVYIFGRIEAFGATEKVNFHYSNEVFDYSFFDLSIDQQLEKLIFDTNCIPGATVFYNQLRIKKYGITNDERIPLLEDWPKWINVLNKGIKLHFIDRTMVRYRIHEDSLSTSRRRPSVHMQLSIFLFTLYYRYPKWFERDETEAGKRFANYHVQIYNELLQIEKQYNQIRSSRAYRLGKWLLTPFKMIKKIFKH